jgi:hypothetical protein
VPIPSGIAAGTRTSTFPSKLVGKWTRIPTDADVRRAHATGINSGTVWTLTVQKNGSAVISGSAGTFSGPIVPAGPSRVHLNFLTPPSDTYAWRASGKTLTFTKVKDSVPDRVAVFNGVWHKSG